MRSVVVVPAGAVERVEPLLRDAGWSAAAPRDEGADGREAALDVVRRGDPVVFVPAGARPAQKLGRIVVVHEGARGDRAGMEMADDAALASGADVVVLHVPGTTSDPMRGSLAFRFADHGQYDLAEWREEFLRRFCRCSPGVKVTLRVGAGSPPVLRDEIQAESPHLVIVSGPPEAGVAEGGLLEALLAGEVPVMIVPSVGRDRAAQADAERGQRKGRPRRAAARTMDRVRDVMTTPVVSVEASTPLKEVAQVLVEHGISGVPVVGSDSGVVGVVTEADFLVKGQGTEAAVARRRFGWLLGESPQARAQLEKLGATNAGEAMSAPAVTVSPDQAIPDAARLMSERRVNRLPVVEDGRLVGIVTRADIVRTYIRSDADIAETIREHVLRDTLWVDPRRFVIEVNDGRVSIAGSVDLRSSAQIIERFVRMVPGVVDVNADVSWSLDDEDVDVPTRDPVFPFSPR
jgi:CBS domain-containing protein